LVTFFADAKKVTGVPAAKLNRVEIHKAHHKVHRT